MFYLLLLGHHGKYGENFNSNPWPKLHETEPAGIFMGPPIDPPNFTLTGFDFPSQARSLLGYYIPWNLVSLSYINTYKNKPINVDPVVEYNSSLPNHLKFGIHLCTQNIINIVNQINFKGLSEDELENRRKYCLYVLLSYVLAHEWSHYRSEVLSFQLQSLFKSVKGTNSTKDIPSYISYLINEISSWKTSFEEVYAEWNAIRYLLHIRETTLSKVFEDIDETEKVDLINYFIDRMLSPGRLKPYGDIFSWVLKMKKHFDSLNINDDQNPYIIKNSSELKYLSGMESLQNGSMIDLLVHNMMQFTPGRPARKIVSSHPIAYPSAPDSVFHLLGEDYCMDFKQEPTERTPFMKLNYPGDMSADNPIKEFYDAVVYSSPTMDGKAAFPLKTFPTFLPLDPVYFHA